MAAGDITVVSGEHDSRHGNYYDGTDDYTLHDNHAVERQATADEYGTYTAWIFLDNISNTYTILSAGDNNVAEYMCLNSVSGKLQFKLYQGGATQVEIIETTAGLTARKWHHVAVVNDDTRINLYVDGVLSDMTDTTTTDADAWYDIISGADKFAIGCLEMNGTHTQDFLGAIGQVKYYYHAMNAAEIEKEYKGEAQSAAIAALLRFNVTYEDDGTTDSGLGADNGTLTGHAVYGGEISEWSWKLNSYATVTGHAAEFINTFKDGSKYVSILKKGD